MNELWRLELLTGGIIMHVFGDEGVFKAALTEWNTWRIDACRGEHDCLEVHGYTDSADRAEHLVVVRMEDITLMSVMRYR